MTVLGIVDGADVMTNISNEGMTIGVVLMTDGFTIAPAMTIILGTMMKTVHIVNI